MTFRDLNVGDTFDFVADDGSFFDRCTKVSARCYTWDSALTYNKFQSKVGTINVHVFHVRRQEAQ